MRRLLIIAALVMALGLAASVPAQGPPDTGGGQPTPTPTPCIPGVACPGDGNDSAGGDGSLVGLIVDGVLFIFSIIP